MNIFSLPIIEIAISVIISWALFAILCSMIQEAFVQLKNERGRFYKKQLLMQFFDTPNQINWASLLYTHSTIDLLSRAFNKPASDISPKIFAEAIIETVANSHIVQSKKLDNDIIGNLTLTKYENALLNDFSFATKVLLPSDVVSFLKSSLNKAEVKAGGIDSKSEDKIYTFLVEEISEWYNQLTSRTTVWYKKLTKKRLFFLGLLMSILLNIDSIRLFNYYKENPQVRTELIKYYEKNKNSLELLANKYDFKDTLSKDSLLKGNIKIDRLNIESIKKDITNFRLKIDSLTKENKIPIGWNISFVSDTAKKVTHIQTSINKTEQSINLFMRIIGFIISAFAASVGAPFWFDVLKKTYSIKK